MDMKRMICGVTLMCLLLTGCSRVVQDPAGGAAQQNQGAQLQEETGGAQPAEEFAKTKESYDMAGLEAAVEGIETKIGMASATGDAASDRADFQALREELDGVEAQVEHMEDSVETDFMAGALSREDCAVLDQQLEALENRLDGAEDLLELVFGFDD